MHHFGIVYPQPAMPNSGIVGYTLQGTNGTFYCMGDRVHDMLFAQADTMLAISNCNGWSVDHNVFYNWNVAGIRTGKGTGSNDWWITQNTLTEGPNEINNSNFILITSSAAPHIIGNKLNAGVGGLSGINGIILNPQFNGSSIEPFVMTSNSIEGNVTGLLAFNSCTSAANGPIATTGTLLGGSGGTFGTYTNVIFTGGTGTDASGTVFINASGAVNVVNIFVNGFGYVVGDTLSATVGGVSGFSFKVASISTGCGVFQSTITGNQIWTGQNFSFQDGLATGFFDEATISGNLLNIVGGAGTFNVNMGAGSIKGVLWSGNTFGNTSGSGATSWFDGGSNQVKFSNNNVAVGANQSMGTNSMASLTCGGTVTNTNDNAVQASFFPTSGSGVTQISRNGAGVITQGSGASPAFSLPLQPGDTLSVVCSTVPAVSYFALNP
jgi:hypothetical protein